MQAPETQSTAVSVSALRLRLAWYRVVQGFVGHRFANSAWPTPVLIDGNARAEG